MARRKNNKHTRGNVAIIVGLMMFGMLGFGALVIDLGHWAEVTNDEHNAVDSGALAGTQHLNSKIDGIIAALDAVKDYASRHTTEGGSQLTVADEDVMFGHWHFQPENVGLCDTTDVYGNTISQTIPCFQSIADGTNACAGCTLDSLSSDVNAIRVTTRRTQATGNAVTAFLGMIFGNTSADLQRTAIAVGGGTEDECRSFPLVVPSCATTSQDPNAPGCNWCSQFQDNNSDTAGWTAFDVNANPQVIADMIRGVCINSDGEIEMDDEGFCAAGCNGRVVGTEAPINNGEGIFQAGGNCSAPYTNCKPCDLIKAILNRNGSPEAFNVKAPVMTPGSADGANCENVQFVGDHGLDGFTTLTILGAACGNNDKDPAFDQDTANDVLGGSGPCATPPSGTGLTAVTQCDVDDDSNEQPDPYFGPRTKLVQ